MEAAFVLEVGSGSPDQDRTGPVPHPVGPDEIGFDPGPEQRWEVLSPSGRSLRLTVWTGARSSHPAHRLHPDGAISMVSGAVRRRQRGWSPPDRWPDEMWGLGPDPDTSVLADELLGSFVALLLTAAGDGWVTADFLGARCLYRGDDGGGADGDRLVVGSRAALVAAHRVGGPQRSDPAATPWLACLGHHIGPATGFEGVSLVPRGTILRLAGGEPSWEETPNPFLGSRPERPVAEVAEGLVEEIAVALRAALELPVARRIINLTGGKDSRLVLAAALHAGLHHEFEYETMGPPDLADVVVAEQLAATFGLDHRTRFLGMRPPDPYADRVRRFVRRTGGTINGWDASEPADQDELRITGFYGETLRTNDKAAVRNPGEGLIDRVWPRSGFARLALVPDLRAAELHAELLSMLDGPEMRATTPFDRLNALYLEHRLRLGRFGAREEVGGETIRFNPLGSPGAIRLVRGLGAADRASGVHFAEVMRRADEALVRIPFASGGWDARVSAHLAAGPPGPTRQPSGPAPEVRTGGLGPDEVGTPLLQRMAADSGDERTDLVAAAVAEADERCWRVFDRKAMDDALRRWSQLSIAERRELFGAATTLMWHRGTD